jgi:hypothetical protein
MGFVLGSEILRNLHWNGFKPDRHIKRLLSRWTDNQIDVAASVGRLQRIIGRKDRALSDNLKWSLIGMEITPDDQKMNFLNLIISFGCLVHTLRKKVTNQNGTTYRGSHCGVIRD